MASIVEHDIAGETSALIALDFADEAGGDGVGRRLLPVVCHCVPGDRNESELARELKHVRTARTEGGTEVANRLAGDVAEQIVGAG